MGINLLPADGKVCTFDCIYCECGFNADHRPKQPLPTREEVRSALEARLRDMQQNGPTPDVLTFAGNGEPTAHPRFPEIIEDTLALRDKYFPNAKVSVLSNSTFIHRPAVFEALNKIDNNILKLDTVDEEYVRVLDRPTGHYSIREIIEGMKAFKGNCIIQTMFLKGSYKGQDMDNTSDKFVLPWLEAVKEIAPRQVMIYTIDRETPDHDLQKATREELKATKKTMAEFREYSTKAEQRAYDRALKELQERQDRAVEEGDAAAVRAVTQEIADLAVEVRDSSMKSQPQAENGMTPDYEEAVEAFKEANPWFETDEDMASWAVALDQKLAGQGMEDKARLKEIAKRAKSVFPHKFENPARRQPSAVEGSTPPRRSSGRTYADLPADAKRTCDSFVKRIPGYTREDYLKNYQWD